MMDSMHKPAYDCHVLYTMCIVRQERPVMNLNVFLYYAAILLPKPPCNTLGAVTTIDCAS